MKKSHRYRLSVAVAEILWSKRLTDQKVDLYLKAFGVPVPYQFDRFGPLQRDYILGTIVHEASDESVAEMAEDLGVVQSVDAGPPPKLWEASEGIRLFISHLAVEKKKAMRLRDCLRIYGVSGFVAHMDIEPTADWQTEIERALFTMDAFLSIHTENFSQSSWTQQEVGFAVARRVPIISLKMVPKGENPTGFIGRQQALLRYSESAEQIAIKVVDLLGEHPGLRTKLAAKSLTVSPSPGT